MIQFQLFHIKNNHYVNCLVNYDDSIFTFSYYHTTYNFLGICVIELKPKPHLKNFFGLCSFDKYSGNIAYFDSEGDNYIKIYNLFLDKNVDSVRFSFFEHDIYEMDTYQTCGYK